MADVTGVIAGAADQHEGAEFTSAAAAGEGLDDEEDDPADAGKSPAERKPIPYPRFAKKNEQFKMTAAELDRVKKQLENYSSYEDFLQQLKKDGINSSEDVRNYLAKQATAGLANQRKSAEESAGARYHDMLREGHTQQVAYEIYVAAMQRAEAQYDKGVARQQLEEANRTKSGSLNARVKDALRAFPLADEETLRDLAQIPGVDLEAKAKRLHEDETRKRADYAKTKSKQRSATGADMSAGASSGGAGNLPPAPNPLKDPKGAKEWLTKFKSRGTA